MGRKKKQGKNSIMDSNQSDVDNDFDGFDDENGGIQGTKDMSDEIEKVGIDLVQGKG